MNNLHRFQIKKEKITQAWSRDRVHFYFFTRARHYRRRYPRLPSESLLVQLTFAQPFISSRIISSLTRMQAANDELFRIGNAYEIIHRKSVSALGRLKVRSHLAATKGKGCCKGWAQHRSPRSYNCRRWHRD